MELQSVLGWWIKKCDNSGLQNVLGVGLQSVAKWITKCVRDYKVWQGGLKSVAGLLLWTDGYSLAITAPS